MKTKIVFLSMMVFMLILPSIIATNVLTEYFYVKGTSTAVTGVDELIFICQDGNCVNVGQPEWFKQNSGSNNFISVTFPNNPEPIIYARYFYKSGYVPLEYKTTVWGTWADTSLDKYFEQVENCKAPIDSFIIQNSVYANEPVAVDVRAILDATTYSAFHDAGKPPYYVPDDYKSEFYSAETRVTLNMYDPLGQLVYTDSIVVNIYMDSSEDVEFTWTPSTAGDGYRAEIVTDVVDNQCSSSETMATSQNFDVLPGRPTDECYVLLNDLSLSDATPEVNQEITVSYTKISNYADVDHEKTAVPMQADYTVRRGKSDPDGQVVWSDSEVVDATSIEEPALVSFSWTPGDVGWQTIYVEGVCSSGLCDGKANHGETLILETYVNPEPVHDIIFTVSDRDTGLRIQGVTMDIDDKSEVTDSNGVATLNDFVSGSYTYTASHPTYNDKSGDIEVGNVDLYVNILLTRQNEAPFINLDSIDPLNINGGDSIAIDFNPLIFDPDNTDGELVLSYTGDNIVSISIANNVVTFSSTIGELGGETITFTVTDPDGAQDSDTLTVTVDDVNQPPVISGLPDITLNEDANMFDAFSLYDYTSDNELPDDQLSYTISDNNCGVSIDELDNVDIDPPLNFNGFCDITVTVSDGEFTDNDSFTVTVNAVNDEPVIDSVPVTLAYEAVLYTYDVEAYDVEGDSLTFLLLVSPDGMSIDSSTGLISWIPTAAQVGDNAVSVQVDDGNDGTDVQDFTINVVSKYQPIVGDIPDVNFNEDESDSTIDLDDYVSDPDNSNDELVWSYSGNNNVIVSIGADRVVTFSAPADWNGQETIIFTATDPDGLSDSDVVVVTVIPVNDGLVIISTPITSAVANRLYEYDVDATDPEGDTLSYSLIKRPHFMSIDSSTGLIRWTPSNYDVGEHDIVVQVSDGELTDMQSFVLTVGKRPKPTADDLMVAQLRMVTGDYAVPGDIITLSVRLENAGDIDLEDVKITALILDLGVRRRIGPFDLDEGDEVNKRVNLEIPRYAAKGVYDIRITVSNDEIRRVIHREFTII